MSRRFAFSAAGFIATSTFGRVARRRRCRGRRCAPGTTTHRRSCRPARGSRPGSSGSVARSLPNTADSSVNRSPTSCMPSPESPANRITTRSSVSARRVGLASTVTVDLQLSQSLRVMGGTTSSARRPRAFIAPRACHCTVAQSARVGRSLYRHAPRIRRSGHRRVGRRSRVERLEQLRSTRRTRGPRPGAGRAPAPRPRPRARPATRSRPPARKKRRRTAADHDDLVARRRASSTHAGGFQHRRPAPTASRPSSRVVTCSCASTVSDGSTRTSGGLEHGAAHDRDVHASRSSAPGLGCGAVAPALAVRAARAWLPPRTARGRDTRDTIGGSAATVTSGCDSDGCVSRARRGARRRRRTPASCAADAVEELARAAGRSPRARRGRRARTRRRRWCSGGPLARCRRAGRASRSPRAGGPRSASEPASTMRPSVTSAADGDAAASSSQSSSTRAYLPLRARRSPSAPGAARPSR